MSYHLDYGLGVEQAIERLAEADPAGAELVVDTMEALTTDPRPAGVHVLGVRVKCHSDVELRISAKTAIN